MKFTVEFYEKENGEIPVINFIDSLEPKMGAKVLSLIEILEEKGNQLRLPYSECLEDGIFELRCKFGSDITRTLYFFYEGANIILTNGFVKKTQKTPAQEIKLAKLRRDDYLSRKEKLK
ncbi:type II toxin-antitoxin system RelE/ParE family toxin [Oribacterium sp.]